MIFRKRRPTDEDALRNIESVYGVELPLELRGYLRRHLDDEVIDGLTWRINPQEIKQKQDELFESTLRFDLENNDSYWPALFGLRPDALGDRVARALEVIRAAPPLIPVTWLKYYVPTKIGGEGKPLPVISFHQFVDTIFKSVDLISHESGQWIGGDFPVVAPWDEIFDGLGAPTAVLYVPDSKEVELDMQYANRHSIDDTTKDALRAYRRRLVDLNGWVPGEALNISDEFLGLVLDEEYMHPDLNVAYGNVLVALLSEMDKLPHEDQRKVIEVMVAGIDAILREQDRIEEERKTLEERKKI
ncbi:MAG TPA: hypothetical protein PKD28_02140 [Candidatus Saccharibacteria bacterium]|nr:hypothetical protein [Candidatus Saccharibacteria bacterium]